MNPETPPQKNSLLSLLRPYRVLIWVLVILTIVSNAFNLAVPKVISRAIDAYTHGDFILRNFIIEFSVISLFIFIFTYFQSVVQTYASEKVARDLRKNLTEKISLQEYSFIQKITPAKLLTNLTSDIDSVKLFVSQAIASIISSLFLIIGGSILLLMINWKLGLAVLLMLPIIGVSFYLVLKRVRKLFKQVQEAIDWLNKVINESILGSALIRLVNSQTSEYKKFFEANSLARDVSLSILRLFAILVPIITFATNLAILIILSFGGHLVITGTMSLGDFTAFNSYLAILIFPIMILGFMSNVMAQASASYQRISEVIDAEPPKTEGLIKADIHGNIEVKNLCLSYGQKETLKTISFVAAPGTKTAIIGPTAAGKTQLLYALTGLVPPTSGSILYDNVPLESYNKHSLHSQVAMVFQDSIVFNMSVRENIAFSTTVTDADLQKAIATAELSDFIDTLPEKLNTVVSERGTTLSGGQKQRLMLARALALSPKVLLLDDFTARVDTDTERRILANVEKNYPGLTLISVTQKIGPIEKYDQIIVLMEGEILATGKHEALMSTTPEYVQIYNSQQSTNSYEVQA